VGHIEFSRGQCRIDSRQATLSEVEALQADLSERVLRLQPWFVVVTLLIVVLAGASHIEKLVLLFSTRKTEVRGIGERLRVALDRYRAYPLRYFTLVGATLSLLAMAGGFYVWLDAVKRSTERALATLQFCHLALQDSVARDVMDEQQRNLQAIEATAGNIRTLVQKLPPEERRKAQEVADRINSAVSREEKLVSDYSSRVDAANRALEAHTVALEKGLSEIGATLATLRSVPGAVADLSLEVKQHQSALELEHATTKGRLAAMEKSLKLVSEVCGRQATPELKPVAAQDSVEAQVAKP